MKVDKVTVGKGYNDLERILDLNCSNSITFQVVIQDIAFLLINIK